MKNYFFLFALFAFLCVTNCVNAQHHHAGGYPYHNSYQHNSYYGYHHGYYHYGYSHPSYYYTQPPVVIQPRLYYPQPIQPVYPVRPVYPQPRFNIYFGW